MRKKIPMAGQELANLVLYDRWLALASLGIAILGLLMVTSASIVISEQQFGFPFHYAIHQLVAFFIGLVAVFAILKLPLNFWARISGPLLLLSFILAVLVLIPGIGHVVNGARRWLVLGPIRIQIAELIKLWIIIYLASYLFRHARAVEHTLGGFLRPVIIVAVLAALLLQQPDFGSAAVIMATTLGMLFLANCRLLPFAALLTTAIAGFAWLALISPYRLRRLTGFLDPWVNQFDSGYQLTQSLIAFGRGGWFGQGLGESVQKLFYLPEAHTDFLFAVLAEELGVVGMAAVIILFAIFIFRGFSVARRARACHLYFGAHLSSGVTLWLGLQAIVNIGVATGLFPTKGLTLPLMSYGGASLIVVMMAVGLLMRIDFEARRQLLGLAPMPAATPGWPKS